MCRKSFGIVLGLVMALTVSMASASVILYDDGSTVSDNWSLTGCTLTSDGDVLRQQSTGEGYATLNLGLSAPVNEFTFVFDFKVTDPGEFVAAYASPPGEGMVIVPWWVAKCSRNQVGFMTIKPDTWYSIGIYSYGTYGYQAFWIAEGKQVNLWNVSRTYEFGWSPWSGSTTLYFYAWANEYVHPTADWEFDNIKVNSGLDLTGVVLPTAETPTFSPDGGFWAGPQDITISCATVGATVYYTIDGTPPSDTNSNGSFTTSGTVSISDNTTLRAIAYKTGYQPSAVASAVYIFPTSYNNPATIPYGMSALNGNVDAEWAGATWTPLDQKYYGDNASADVAEAYYAARWTENKVYVVVKVLDTSHVLNNSYVGWNQQDDVELYLHTTGTGPTNYNANQADAQQYVIGIKQDNVTLWSVLNGVTIPSHAGFSAVGKATGQWLYYEAALTPFNHYDNTTGAGDIISPLSAGDIIGLDAVVSSRNGAAFSMLSENLWTNKSYNYAQFGIHLLGAKPTYTATTLSAVLAAMDSTPGGGTWNAEVDFDGDGEITSSDLSIVLANLP